MLTEIPKTFTIANRTWRVQFKPLKRAYGRSDFDKATIYLDERLVHSPELLLQTFLHELLHALANGVGWKTLNDDEDRIDALAGLLAQAVTTMRG